MEVLDSGGKRTGAMLAAGRTAAGLELVDIARETRVPLRHLKALEADQHDGLPALPYATGFVKAFARTVGLDPEAVAAQFRAETSKSAHVPTAMSLEALDERRLPSSALVALSVGVVVLIIAGLSAWGAGAFDPKLPVTAVAPVPAAAAPDPLAVDAGSAATDPVNGAPPAAAPAAIPAVTAPMAGQVVLTAREDVWFRVYDRSGKLREAILKTGERYPVPADHPGLMLRTGKAGAIDVSIGGRSLPPLGGPVDTIKDVSLAPADLVARATGLAVPGAETGPTPIAQIPRPRAEAAPVPPASQPSPGA